MLTLRPATRGAFHVGGHTHQRMVRKFGRLTVLNPGTLYRKDRPCAMLVDFARRQAAFYGMTDALTFEAPQTEDI